MKSKVCKFSYVLVLFGIDFMFIIEFFGMDLSNMGVWM